MFKRLGQGLVDSVNKIRHGVTDIKSNISESFKESDERIKLEREAAKKRAEEKVIARRAAELKAEQEAEKLNAEIDAKAAKLLEEQAAANKTTESKGKKNA